MELKYLEQTCGGTSSISANAKLLSDRKIFIENSIDSESATNFFKQILLLNQESRSEPIKVYINSNGGSVFEGLRIYDFIQGSEAPIELYCIGAAYSMAAVLFASGKHGRYICENSKMMLHEPLIGPNFGGSSSSIRNMSESLLKIKHQIDNILAKHTGKTLEEIEKVTDEEVYFTASEAVDFGLADGIIHSFDQML